jgi:hypothetical protein
MLTLKMKALLSFKTSVNIYSRAPAYADSVSAVHHSLKKKWKIKEINGS